MNTFLIIALFPMLDVTFGSSLHQAYHVYGSHIPMEILDMTYLVNEKTVASPFVQHFKLDVTQNGTMEFNNKNLWVQLENIFTSTHIGTHMDARCHIIYGAKCVDKVHLQQVIDPAAVVDVTESVYTNRDSLVQPEDIQKWEEITGQSLDGTIILIKTGYGRYYADKNAYLGNDGSNDDLHFPGLSREAAQWIVNNRDVHGIGIDTLSLDYGIVLEGDVHKILLGANLFGLENVANMDKIPIHGATLITLPMKIENSSGAPARVIAIFPKNLAP